MLDCASVSMCDTCTCGFLQFTMNCLLNAVMQDNSIQMKRDIQSFVYNLRLSAEVQVIEMVGFTVDVLLDIQVLVSRHLVVDAGSAHSVHRLSLWPAHSTSLWNSLPDILRDPDVGRDNFRRLLKTLLFTLY